MDSAITEGQRAPLFSLYSDRHCDIERVPSRGTLHIVVDHGKSISSPTSQVGAILRRIMRDRQPCMQTLKQKRHVSARISDWVKIRGEVTIWNVYYYDVWLLK